VWVNVLFLVGVLSQDAQARHADIEVRDLRCGAYCMYVALKGFGFEVPNFEAFVQELGGREADGYSIARVGVPGSSRRDDDLRFGTISQPPAGDSLEFNVRLCTGLRPRPLP
jgi:hypothetical protein